MRPAVTPADLLLARLVWDPSGPLLTFYDDDTGERTELSALTLDNWVAKTANMLRDGFGVVPGARVAILLPLHWQHVVWMLACWSSGSVAAPGADPAGADLVVAGPDRLEQVAREAAGDVVALSLRPLGGRFSEPLPAGVLDYGAEAPGFGDTFTPYAPLDATAPALEIGGRTLDGAEVLAAGRAAAETAGITDTDRVLTTRDLMSLPGIAVGLLAPLATGASLVLSPNAARNLDAAAFVRRVHTERVTVVVGPRPTGPASDQATDPAHEQATSEAVEGVRYV